MATNTEIVKSLFTAEYATALASNQNAQAEAAKVFGDRYAVTKSAADAMANTATAETATAWRSVAYAGKVTSVIVNPTAALTGDPTNNAVITISKRDAAGANALTVATLTTTASWVAGTAVAFTLTSANVALVAGGSLTLTITKGGSGVVVPISEIIIFVERT